MMGPVRAALGSLVVVLLLAGCSFTAGSPKDNAMNACTAFGKALVKISDQTATMEELKPALEEAESDAKSAAAGDSRWRGLADALADLNTANRDGKATAAASDKVWSICAPYVGT
jgi:cytochrome c556